MALKDLVIQSQLIPPHQRKGVLRRPRLEARLAGALDYPLTIVQADTGYGKSTALAALADMVEHLFWYTITEPDRDPFLFVAHLVHSVARLEPSWSEASISALESSGVRVSLDVLTPLLNAAATDLHVPAVLVLDDYHLVSGVPEIAASVERLIDYAPPNLHIVIASREMPSFGALNRWRVKGQVLSIRRGDLAFTAQEIAALFGEQYGYPLSAQQSEALAAETEGWAIALQMVWQGLQSGAVSDVDVVLGHLPTSLQALFDYLAQEVLVRQEPPTQEFLVATSVLREMDGQTCDVLLGVSASATILRKLYERGLFVVAVGDNQYRYQRLFHDFLQARLAQDTERLRALHRRAAAHFSEQGQLEEAIYHLLESHEYSQTAELIEKVGRGLIEQGRLDSLGSWIAHLPADVRRTHPDMDLLMGDLLRLRACFDDALEQYASAEMRFAEQGDRLGHSRALRGQAQVYLDTVRPLKADSLLEQALYMLEPGDYPQEVSALLDQLAENRLNLGYPHEAEALHHEARLLRSEDDPGAALLEARAMIRTGRLADAQRLLQVRALQDVHSDRSRPQRFHRESVLLLSLLAALQGDVEAARQYAREGIAIGERLGSTFVEMVGQMRLGHALQLRKSRPWYQQEDSSIRQAMALYDRSIVQIRTTFNVMRTQVEPLWGLCRASGYSGDLSAAEEYAHQALAIARQAGDEWMCNQVQLAMGASCALERTTGAARRWLGEAATGFEHVGDPFGWSAARMWLALDSWWSGDTEAAMQSLSDMLAVAQERGYDVLLGRRAFMGLKDDQAAVPMLLAARQRAIHVAYTERLLEGMGLAETEYHPGYTLFVRTLDSFSVWRGEQTIAPQEWKREKARQVFQLLVTFRGQWLHRDQIMDLLWPHVPPEVAERDFKVALSTVNRALEPDRPQGAQTFFVTRRESLYGLNPAARIVIDADEFRRWAGSDDAGQMREALGLYVDDYLADNLYEDWPAAERQQLRHIYLATSERLAGMMLNSQEWDEAIRICHSILSRDHSWEAAYRLLMQAYAGQGNRPQVHQVYQQCVTALCDDLGVEPSPATQSLFEALS